MARVPSSSATWKTSAHAPPAMSGLNAPVKRKDTRMNYCSVCGWTLGTDVPELATGLEPMCYECADDMGIMPCDGCGTWDHNEDMTHNDDMSFCQSCSWGSGLSVTWGPKTVGI